MFTVKKTIQITVDTQSISDDIYRIFGLDYKRSMYNVRKFDQHHYIDLEFEDTEKAYKLYERIKRYSPDYLSLEDVKNILTPTTGFEKARLFSFVTTEELNTLNKIRSLLDADGKFERDMFTIFYGIIEENNHALITLKFKCDQLILF